MPMLRLLLDQMIDVDVAAHLSERGHDVLVMSEEGRFYHSKSRLPLSPLLPFSLSFSPLSLREAQLQHPRLPLLLEPLHVAPAEHFAERFVAAGVLFPTGVEAVVELPQKIVLLEVVAEVPGLAVVRARVFVVELVLARGAEGQE